MNINAPNEDNLHFISPLFCIQVPSFHRHWFVVKEQICHSGEWEWGGRGKTATSFILNLSRKTPLLLVQLRRIFFFFFLHVSYLKKKHFFFFSSCLSNLSRCVRVLIRYAQPILLFCHEENKRQFRFSFFFLFRCCDPAPAKKINGKKKVAAEQLLTQAYMTLKNSILFLFNFSEDPLLCAECKHVAAGWKSHELQLKPGNGLGDGVGGGSV